jgi:(2Fe-2S) ferredoxin
VPFVPVVVNLIRMDKKVADGMKKAGVAAARRHIFICIGPDCCKCGEGGRLWEHAKARIKLSGAKVMRTKAGCFRICAGGPWMVVYPEGVWYGAVTPQKFDRILVEHILGGKPVREWAAAENALGKSDQ